MATPVKQRGGVVVASTVLAASLPPLPPGGGTPARGRTAAGAGVGSSSMASGGGSVATLVGLGSPTAAAARSLSSTTTRTSPSATRAPLTDSMLALPPATVTPASRLRMAPLPHGAGGATVSVPPTLPFAHSSLSISSSPSATAAASSRKAAPLLPAATATSVSQLGGNRRRAPAPVHANATVLKVMTTPGRPAPTDAGRSLLAAVASVCAVPSPLQLAVQASLVSSLPPPPAPPAAPAAAAVSMEGSSVLTLPGLGGSARFTRPALPAIPGPGSPAGGRAGALLHLPSHWLTASSAVGSGETTITHIYRPGAGTGMGGAAAAAVAAESAAGSAFVAEYKRLRKLATAALAIQCWWRGAPFRESLQTVRLIRVVDTRRAWRAWRSVYLAYRKYKRHIMQRVWSAWKFASDHKRDLQRLAQMLARRHLCGIRISPHGAMRLTMRVFMNPRVTTVDKAAPEGSRHVRRHSITAKSEPTVEVGDALLSAVNAASGLHADWQDNTGVASDSDSVASDSDAETSSVGRSSPTSSPRRRRARRRRYRAPPTLSLISGFVNPRPLAAPEGDAPTAEAAAPLALAPTLAAVLNGSRRSSSGALAAGGGAARAASATAARAGERRSSPPSPARRRTSSSASAHSRGSASSPPGSPYARPPGSPGGEGAGDGREAPPSREALDSIMMSDAMLSAERVLTEMSGMLSQFARDSLRGSSSMLRSRLLHIPTSSTAPFVHDVADEASAEVARARRRGRQYEEAGVRTAAGGAGQMSAWATAWGAGATNKETTTEASLAAALQHIEGGGQHMLVALVAYQLKRQWFDAFHEMLVTRRRVTHELCARLRGALSSSLRQQMAQEWPQQRMAIGFIMWRRWTVYRRTKRSGAPVLHHEGVRLAPWDTFVARVEGDAAKTEALRLLQERNLRRAVWSNFHGEMRHSRRRRRLMVETLRSWALLPLRMAFNTYRRHVRGLAVRHDRLRDAVAQWRKWRKWELVKRTKLRVIRATLRHNGIARAWRALRDIFVANAPQRARAAKRLQAAGSGTLFAATGNGASRANMVRLRSTFMQAAFQLNAVNNSSASTLATMIACWRGWRLFAARRRAWQRLQAAYAREAYFHLLTTVFMAWRTNTKFKKSRAAAAASAAAAAATADAVGLGDADSGSDSETEGSASNLSLPSLPRPSTTALFAGAVATAMAGTAPSSLVPAAPASTSTLLHGASPLAALVAAAHLRRASHAAGAVITFTPADLIPSVNIARFMAMSQTPGDPDSLAFTSALLAPRDHRTLAGAGAGASSSVARTAAMLLRARQEGRGWTAVHAAAEMLDFKKLHKLLSAGLAEEHDNALVDVSARDLHGATALHILAAKVSLQAVPSIIMLLLAGAQPLAQDDRGRTCLDVATNPVTLRILQLHVQRLQEGRLAHCERTLLLRWRTSYCNLLNTRWLMSALCPALLHATAVMAEAQALVAQNEERQREAAAEAAAAALAAAAAADSGLDGSDTLLGGEGGTGDGDAGGGAEGGHRTSSVAGNLERISAARATIGSSLAQALNESVQLRLADMSVQRAFGIDTPMAAVDAAGVPGPRAPSGPSAASPARGGGGGGSDSDGKAAAAAASAAAAAGGSKGAPGTVPTPAPLSTGEDYTPSAEFSTMLRSGGAPGGGVKPKGGAGGARRPSVAGGTGANRRASSVAGGGAGATGEESPRASGPTAAAVATGRGLLVQVDAGAPSEEAMVAAEAAAALEARKQASVMAPPAVVDVCRMPTEMHRFCVRSGRASLAAVLRSLDGTTSVVHQGDRLLRTLETVTTRGESERAARLEALASQVSTAALPSEAAISTLAAQAIVGAAMRCGDMNPEGLVPGTETTVADEVRWIRRTVASAVAEAATVARQIDMFRTVALDMAGSVSEGGPGGRGGARRRGGQHRPGAPESDSDSDDGGRGGGAGGGAGGGGAGSGAGGGHSILAASVAFVDLRRKLATLERSIDDFRAQLKEADTRLAEARRARIEEEDAMYYD